MFRSDSHPHTKPGEVALIATQLRPGVHVRLPLGWPGEFCRFEHPMDYIGFDGGGGIGSGPGMAVGAALAGPLAGFGRAEAGGCPWIEFAYTPETEVHCEPTGALQA